MIDGFDVDISTQSESGENGTYKQNKVTALYNSDVEKRRKEEEELKEDTPFFVNFGESATPPKEYEADPDSEKGYYIKEGKYIGKTVENYVATTKPNTPNNGNSQASGQTSAQGQNNKNNIKRYRLCYS